MGKNFLGEFEELVLIAVFGLGKNAYGVTIANRIEQATGKTVSTGALYTTLSRLEEKGFISSWMGEPTDERGGRAKKFYTLKSGGEEALKNSSDIRKSLRSGLNFTFK